MPRTRRLVLPALPHHVILRGNNRRRLFSFASDYLCLLRLLGRALGDTHCQLHAATLMSNHLHLVVTPPDGPALSAMVKSFAQRYAQYRNLRRGASGKLFEQRFKSFTLTSQDQVAITTVYCDLNPLRAGMVQDPLRYPWTTYGLHAGNPAACRFPVGLWTPSPWYVGLGETDAARAARYLEWVAASTEARRAHEARLQRAEAESAEPYTRRLERPTGRAPASPHPRTEPVRESFELSTNFSRLSMWIVSPLPLL